MLYHYCFSTLLVFMCLGRSKKSRWEPLALAYTDALNLLGDNKDTVSKGTDTLTVIDARKRVGMEVYADKSGIC
jgi:hypothetical protein